MSAAGERERLTQIRERVNAATERHVDCDMGDNGGPCETCLAVRELREELSWLLSRVTANEERDDWLVKQLDGLIEDAEILATTVGLALARSVVGNLRAARAALAGVPVTDTEEGT